MKDMFKKRNGCCWESLHQGGGCERAGLRPSNLTGSRKWRLFPVLIFLWEEKFLAACSWEGLVIHEKPGGHIQEQSSHTVYSFKWVRDKSDWVCVLFVWHQSCWNEWHVELNHLAVIVHRYKSLLSFLGTVACTHTHTQTHKCPFVGFC